MLAGTIGLGGLPSDDPLATEVWVSFSTQDGAAPSPIRRPAFWDGTVGEWQARFNPPSTGGWRWKTEGLPGGETSGEGHFAATPLLKMSGGGRSFVWSDGTPFFPVVDTAWAMPWRATQEETLTYCQDRQSKGFTGALLMTVQPDTLAEGPEERTEKDGFARGLSELHKGRIKGLVHEYWNHLDRQIETLLSHGIVPFHTPLFFGFGWKGLGVIGWDADPEEAGDFVRYLCARYGAWPGVWVVGADGRGTEPAVEAMGAWLGRNDFTRQPRGIHYNPWQPCDAHLHEDWCHFHLCQTGHSGDHLPDRVTHLASRIPVRGIANGEPTYEGMGGGRHGLRDWQMREAWQNLVSGGTLGCFYGAASLWQWKREGETAWGDWAAAPYDWREALSQPGSLFPGVLGRVLQGYDFSDMQVSISRAHWRQCVEVPGKFALIWLPEGGIVEVEPWGAETPWSAHCAKTGRQIAHGSFTRTNENAYMGVKLPLPEGEPLVVVAGHKRPDS